LTAIFIFHITEAIFDEYFWPSTVLITQEKKLFELMVARIDGNDNTLYMILFAGVDKGRIFWLRRDN
jgi:ABC-type glycerol-3-phosphate transport system permease component